MVNDAASWDERYLESDLVWSIEPNVWVRQVVEPLAPGSAIDIAAGEGRNALWMVERGWRMTALDYSTRSRSSIGLSVTRESSEPRSLSGTSRAATGRHSTPWSC